MYKQKHFILSQKMDPCNSEFGGCLYYAANALARIMTSIAEEEFAITGLTPSYAFVLLTVNSNPGIQPKAISKHMQLKPSTVTRFLDKLESRGYLDREISGRNTCVYPNKKSLVLDGIIRKAWGKLYARYSGMIGEEEGRELTKLINRSIDRLSV